MNCFNGIGRLVADPEIRHTQDGMAVARYRVAIDRRKKGEADFIGCVAFGKTAEFAEKYLRKGMKIGISGEIRTGSYEKDGRKVYTTDVIVNGHTFCEKAGEQSVTADSNGFMAVPEGTDEELPFSFC